MKTSKFNYFILFIIPILFFVMENFVIDNDFWFTIAEGKYVLKKGFPHTVPFTIYNNLDFIYQSWGTGVIFYLIHKYFGLYALLASIIIYILNQTIKPILVYLTLPITALTLGLFYPLINVLILYITSFILGNNFQIHGIIIPFIIAILISLLNIFVEGLIIKPIINMRRDIDE